MNYEVTGRVTKEERERFHEILDDSINKMNNSKNCTKPHWKGYDIKELQKMINIENSELDCACFTGSDIISENYDLINLNLMMVDNLKGNK